MAQTAEQPDMEKPAASPASAAEPVVVSDSPVAGGGSVRSLTDVRGRFRENWPGYVYEYRIFLVLLVLASLADMASTIHFMLRTGPAGEWHPTVRMLSYLFGPIFGPVFGKAIQVIVVVALTVYLRRRAIFVFIPVVIMYAWAAWYNIWGHQLYYPPFLRFLEYLAI